MARPERNNVDYFPFLCKEGKAMYYIDQKYGNDGYATWVKILRQLAVTNFHYLNLSDKIEFMFLASKCRVSEELLSSIINDLCELGEFNKDLWIETQILWNEKFIDHVKDAYIKRSNLCMTFEGLLTLIDSLGIRKLGKSNLKGTVNPQTKEKKRKEDKIYRDFVLTDYEECFKKWLEYKAERKETYKSEQSVKMIYNKLVLYSNGDPKIAEHIVEKSIVNNWAGIFELKHDEIEKLSYKEPEKQKPMTDEEYEEYVRPKNFVTVQYGEDDEL